MVSHEILKQDAAIIKHASGSTYVLLPSEMKKIVGLSEEEIDDLKIAVAESDKYGRFFYIYSPKNQKRYQKEKMSEMKNQMKINGGEKQ